MNKKAIIIGQAPPLKNYEVPFGGTRLYEWLSTIGIPKKMAIELFEFEALVATFPGLDKKGKHMIPTPRQIQEHIPVILDKIQSQKIELVIPVGVNAIKYVMGDPSIKLDNVVGFEFSQTLFNKLDGNSCLIIPLPHPSGASPWVHLTTNKGKLEKALNQIKRFLI